MPLPHPQERKRRRAPKLHIPIPPIPGYSGQTKNVETKTPSSLSEFSVGGSLSLSINIKKDSDELRKVKTEYTHAQVMGGWVGWRSKAKKQKPSLPLCESLSIRDANANAD